jgi:hypothetical protein
MNFKYFYTPPPLPRDLVNTSEKDMLSHCIKVKHFYPNIKTGISLLHQNSWNGLLLSDCTKLDVASKRITQAILTTYSVALLFL